MDTLPSIWVPEEDRARARELIERALKETPAPDDDWICAGCGEAIEGQFTECWQCGAARAPV
jgi:hypothetical protein